MENKTKKFNIEMIILIAIIGLFASFYFGNRQDDMYDILFVFLYQHGLSTYYQVAVYFIVFVQVVRIRNVRELVAIRNKTEETLLHLLSLVVIEWAVFWLCVLGPYALFHHSPLFKFGNPLLGSMLLGMHMLIMLLLMVILVAAYNMPFPYLVLVFGILATLACHDYLDRGILLPKYSVIFDPLYRAIHQIYF